MILFLLDSKRRGTGLLDGELFVVFPRSRRWRYFYRSAVVRLVLFFGPRNNNSRCGSSFKAAVDVDEQRVRVEEWAAPPEWR